MLQTTALVVLHWYPDGVVIPVSFSEPVRCHRQLCSIMRTEAEGANRASVSSSVSAATASGGAPEAASGEEASGERQNGSQFTDPLQNSVLHPDVTFGASPYAHVLHVFLFAGCCLLSIGCLFAQLPTSSTGSTSWWPIFGPQILFPVISIAFHLYSVLPSIQKRAIRMQIGETPNPSTTVSSCS